MHRKLALLFVPLVLALPGGACGDDDEKDASRAVRAAFELTGTGDRAKMSGPKSVEAGAVRVNFRNATDDDGGVTFVRIQGDHTAAEAVKAGEAWGDGGKALPEWVRFVGGVSSIQPGGSFTSVQNLAAGAYAAVDINTNAYVGFEVTGDGDGELPTTSGRIEAQDYSFKASGLKAGRSRILFTNNGKQPHFALAAPIKPGKTIEDVRESLKEEEEGAGEPPIIEKQSVSSGILDGGQSQVVDLTLRKGKYAFVCFVPDRKGGPPHAVLGMVSEGIVE